MRRRTRSIILAVFASIFLWILSRLVLNRAPSQQPQQDKQATRFTSSAIKSKFRGSNKQNRIAIVIPFFGESPESIPSYLPLFVTGAAGSASLVDFLIIHNGILQEYTLPLPSNVYFINLGSTREFAQRLMRVVDRKQDKDIAVASREQLLKIVTYHIHQYPYVLVEFKPAIGHIFSEFLEGYSHWGYSDLDIVFGDLPKWITTEELSDYDIVTYGYGDQNRVYLRGQFTIHKNTPRINQIWRECNYLSNMDERFASVLSGKSILRVESAEGCYSAAVLKQKDIRVKYAVKAFNDINAKDTANTHGVFFGIGSNKRDVSVIYKAASAEDASAAARLSPTWFQEKGSVYSSKETHSLQKQVGKRELVPPSTDATKSKCMYWVEEKVQKDICITGVTSNDTVFWIDGKLYKQPYENVKLPGNVVSGPFFHFQEWKRYYRSAQLASVHRSTEGVGWLLTKEGAIPLSSRDSHTSKWKALVTAPLAHHGVKQQQWTTANDVNRDMLPHSRYCLTSAPRKNPPKPVVSACFDSASWQDTERVEILLGAPVWKHIDAKREVTLALTLQITAEQGRNERALDGILDVAIANVNAWQGQPCVLVVHMAGATDESVARAKSRLSTLDPHAALVALIRQEETTLVSRKALLNMASDAARTRWIVTGLEIERGLVLSDEASALAYRRAKIQQETTGSVFLIPQFAIETNEGDRKMSFSFNDLSEMRRTGEPVVYGPDEFDEACKDDDGEQGSNDAFRQAQKLWWRLSTKETAQDYTPLDEATFRDLASSFDGMQQSFTKLLTPEQGTELYSMDNSPILMTDSIGPTNGMQTSELVREIEEFAGKRCYNGLRLAQLAALGYNFNVLTDAFAISTSSSREPATSGLDDEEAHGVSRCDGCFMFDDKHESIVTAIEDDERIRTAKAVMLWDYMKSASNAHEI